VAGLVAGGGGFGAVDGISLNEPAPENHFDRSRVRRSRRRRGDTHREFFSHPPSAQDQALLAHSPFLLASVFGWAAFGLYWEVAARNAAKAKTSESKGSRTIHLFLANAALVLEIVPAAWAESCRRLL